MVRGCGRSAQAATRASTGTPARAADGNTIRCRTGGWPLSPNNPGRSGPSRCAASRAIRSRQGAAGSAGGVTSVAYTLRGH